MNTLTLLRRGGSDEEERVTTGVNEAQAAETAALPTAIRLVNDGYPVYLTRAKVKGKDWMRLRVGFFKNRTEATTEAKKIMGLLKLADC
jgi:hypothetical protein